MDEKYFNSWEESFQGLVKPAHAQARIGAHNAPDLSTIEPTTLQGVGVPERDWIVEDWIPVHCTTALYGDGGTGKSLIAMQLMTAVALSKPWLGRMVKPVKTLGFFCEDSRDELHRRQADINRAYDCDFSDLQNMRWYSGVGEDNSLMTFDHSEIGDLTALYSLLEKKAIDFGAQLIVIDTAADTFGGNENVRGQVRRFIGCLTKLAIKIDGAVVLCAHPSLSGINSGRGDGGNTAWNNSVRSRLYLERKKAEDDSEEPDERFLSRKKSNYARVGDGLQLRWQNGIFVPNQGEAYGVLAGLEKADRNGAAEVAFIRSLAALEKQGRLVSASKTAGNYAPKEMLTVSHCYGFKRKEIESAMNRLFDRGAIEVISYGRGSNPSRKIVKVGRDDRSSSS